MKTKRRILTGITAIILLLAAVAPVMAQSELTLTVGRDFGYGGFGGDIRGTFTLSVSGPENIQSVTYTIDGQPMQELTTAPFKLQFSTNSYPVGVHELGAVAVTADGRTLTSNTAKYTFLSAEQESSSLAKILVPLGIVVGGIMLVMVLTTFLNIRAGKRQDLPLGAPRTYGAFGGAICPKCHRPFSMHWWAFNAGILSKFDRCPYCARFSVVKRASMDALRRAEQAELALARAEAPIHELTEEEKLRQQIESSKFEG